MYKFHLITGNGSSFAYESANSYETVIFYITNIQCTYINDAGEHIYLVQTRQSVSAQFSVVL